MLKGREKLASVSDEMRIIPVIIAHIESISVCNHIGAKVFER